MRHIILHANHIFWEDSVPIIGMLSFKHIHSRLQYRSQNCPLFIYAQFKITKIIQF